MKTISVLDTSICSSNLGDQIIMDAVNSILYEMFPDRLFINFPTHDVISSDSYRLMSKSSLIFVGGTNLLSSNMNSYNQWKVSLMDSLFITNITLMGVGWWQYQNQPNLYTKILYKRLLSKKYLHSVRDSYTEKQLKLIGINNVINTACPTMWKLTQEHCVQIPQGKAESVLVTFTEYNQNPSLDKQLVELLKQEYKLIYYWTQQPKDYQHMKDICGEGAIYLNPSLSALDMALSEYPVDYVGTRLHAGIRALQYKRRTLILSVDNRATEISKDTNLPVVQRDDLNSVANWINAKEETLVKIPLTAINEWKKQFLANVNNY